LDWWRSLPSWTFAREKKNSNFSEYERWFVIDPFLTLNILDIQLSLVSFDKKQVKFFRNKEFVHVEIVKFIVELDQYVLLLISFPLTS
jgi:hypothetical protein